MKWFGPMGFEMTTANLDFRPGGMFHYCVRLPQGNEMWGKFEYREIVRPEKLVLVSSFSDTKGGSTRHPMSPTWPREMLSTSTFFENNGKTTLTLEMTPLNASQEETKMFLSAKEGMKMGWNGMFEQLEAYLRDG